MSADLLNNIGERLHKLGSWLGVRTIVYADPGAIITKCRGGHTAPYWRMESFSGPSEGRAATEFTDKRVPVPLAKPWHTQEALPPAGIRGGNWMVDLTIAR